ncbi:MAG: hypothetical protein N3A72_01725 [bacterium]|nr:hypothetical protein [bacterium]
MYKKIFLGIYLLSILSSFLIISSLGIAAPTVTLNGSGTIVIGDTRVLIASGGVPPYTWSIKTVSGAPGILSAYSGATVSFLATVDVGTCYVVVTDNSAQASTTNNLTVVSSPIPIKSYWIWGSSISNRSAATTVITTSTTHQIRDVFLLVKGTSGTFDTTRLVWMTQIAKGLNTNVRIHPWVICFSDSSAATLGIYTTVSSTWISPMDPRYRQYLMDSCIIPLVRDHPDINGVHLDCFRYPGNAYNYDTGLSLVKFCLEIVTTVRRYNPAIPVSIAVMPETSNNEYSYGQSYYKLSTAGARILALMAYTGNYEQTAAWVGRVIKYARNTAVRTCSIYAGLQFTYDTGGYMPAAEIAAETRYAIDSGTQGVAAFRWPIQSYQWTAWDTVGNPTPLTISPTGTITLQPIGASTVFQASGGWQPYTRWTTSNWSIGSVAVFWGESSARFYVCNTGTCTIIVRDSAPGPASATSVVIQCVPVELIEFEAIIEPEKNYIRK